MAIQFSCPSCRQPIEVDLELAGREVECPYCHNVVTARMASTYMASPNVPTARGLANAAALAGPGDPTIRPPGNPAALWGLGLACLCFVLFLAAVLLIGASVPAEFSEKLPGQLAEQPTDPPWDPKSDSLPPALVAGVMMLLVSLGVWVVGLVCAPAGIRLGGDRAALDHGAVLADRFCADDRGSRRGGVGDGRQTQDCKLFFCMRLRSIRASRPLPGLADSGLAKVPKPPIDSSRRRGMLRVALMGGDAGRRQVWSAL